MFSNLFRNTTRKAPGKAREAEKQDLVDIRKDWAEIPPRDEGGTNTADLNTRLPVNAEQRLANFEAARRRYYEIKPELWRIIIRWKIPKQTKR